MTIEQYLKEIRKYPLLGQKKEKEVATLAKAGDLTSRESLINSNLRLVISIVKRYSRNGILDDLIQQGNHGLIKAVDRFNPDLGYRFSTYATWWIKQGVFSYFEGLNPIKLSSEQRELRSKIFDIIFDYFGTHSEEPSHEQIAGELNKSTGENYSGRNIKELLWRYDNIKVSSLNRAVGENGDGEQIDLIPGLDGKDTLESMASASTVDIVHNQIIQLKTDDLTKKILEERLYNHKQLDELVDILGLRRERIKQTYDKGIRLLKYALRNNPQFTSSMSLPQYIGQ